MTRVRKYIAHLGKKGTTVIKRGTRIIRESTAVGKNSTLAIPESTAVGKKSTRVVFEVGGTSEVPLGISP